MDPQIIFYVFSTFRYIKKSVTFIHLFAGTVEYLVLLLALALVIQF